MHGGLWLAIRRNFNTAGDDGLRATEVSLAVACQLARVAQEPELAASHDAATQCSM